MRSARRAWWAAILFGSACGGTAAVHTEAGGTTGSGGAQTGATSSTGAGGGGGAPDGGFDPCNGGLGGGFQIPLPDCSTNCLVALKKGGSPTILYERPSTDTYALGDLLAVTDDYVIATAIWGAQGWSDPGAVWGLVEVPRAGGSPVLVDTFGTDFDYFTAAIDGGDGYLYYDVESAPQGTGPPHPPLSLRRVPTNQMGVQASVLASAPSSYWNVTLAVDQGYIYMAADWGMARVPAGGGALQNLVAGEIYDYGSPDAMALRGGWAYYGGGVIQRVPAAGGMPSTVAPDQGLVAFGGVPASLFVMEQTTVLRFDANDENPVQVLAAPAGRFAEMSFVGTRLYVLDQCPDLHPDGDPAPGSFTLSYDTATGATGYLEQEPGYPFVPGPTGLAHDATGETIYYTMYGY